jgi:hypothetical protein
MVDFCANCPRRIPTLAHLASIIITHSTKTEELLANNHLLFKICAMIELEK